jgi:hypothetical protein
MSRGSSQGSFLTLVGSVGESAEASSSSLPAYARRLSWSWCVVRRLICESPASRSLRRSPHAVCSSTWVQFRYPEESRSQTLTRLGRRVPQGRSPGFSFAFFPASGFICSHLPPSRCQPGFIRPSTSPLLQSPQPPAARSLQSPQDRPEDRATRKPRRPKPTLETPGGTVRPSQGLRAPSTPAQRVRSTRGLRHPVTFRPWPFSGLRRFSPRCTLWPSFMPQAPTGFPPLPGFPLPGEPPAFRRPLPS